MYSSLLALIENQVVLEEAGEDGKDTGDWEVPRGRENHGLVYNRTLSALMLQVYYRNLRTFDEVNMPAATEIGEAYKEDIVVSVIPGSEWRR